MAASTSMITQMLQMYKESIWTRNQHLSEQDKMELWRQWKLQHMAVLLEDDDGFPGNAVAHNTALVRQAGEGYGRIRRTSCPGPRCTCSVEPAHHHAPQPASVGMSRIQSDPTSYSLVDPALCSTTAFDASACYPSPVHPTSEPSPSVLPAHFGFGTGVSTGGNAEYSLSRGTGAGVHDTGLITVPSTPLAVQQASQDWLGAAAPLHTQFGGDTIQPNYHSQSSDQRVNPLPPTPTTCELTTASTCASNMSRQNSVVNTSCPEPVDMMPFPSFTSNPAVTTWGDHLPALPGIADGPAIGYAGIQSSHFPSVSNCTCHQEQCFSFSSTSNAVCPPGTTGTCRQDTPNPLKRPAEDALPDTAPSSKRYHTRRSAANAKPARPLVPKLPEGSKSASEAAENVLEERSPSASVIPAKRAISKTSYVRPVYPKKMCPHCEEHPEGFRGEHELRRHVERAHSTIRKVWICVNASSDPKFLSHCKACRTEKRYGAYYNAAAHLRRAHFNRRQRGRGRGKTTERRGGIGGGDKPSMEELKKWMKEVDEVVTTNTKSDTADEKEEESDGDVSKTSPEPNDIQAAASQALGFDVKAYPLQPQSCNMPPPCLQPPPINMQFVAPPEASPQTQCHQQGHALWSWHNQSSTEPMHVPYEYGSFDGDNFHFSFTDPSAFNTFSSVSPSYPMQHQVGAAYNTVDFSYHVQQ